MKNNLKKPAPDEIFQLNNEYNQDEKQDKINGGIGIYLDDFGNSYVLPVVQKAISSMPFSNFNYLPISGDPDFLKESIKLVLGDILYSVYEKNIASQGVMGGTNGLFIWGNLIKRLEKSPLIVLSNPTWENHKKIFSQLGFNIKEYQHINSDQKFNFNAIKKIISANPQAHILFHGGSTHNPTGINPNKKQWQKLVQLIKDNKNYVCFDFAYMGLGENIDKDCFPVRLFIKNRIPTSVIISYSKNMTLYQQRVGLLFTICKNQKEKELVDANLKNIFRMVNSNPAGFGELIVKTILKSRELKKEWTLSLNNMVRSLNKRRSLFAKYSSPEFSQIKDQKGLFSLLNLPKEKIKILKNKYGVYLLSNSRINFGGISTDNIKKVASAISEISSG